MRTINFSADRNFEQTGNHVRVFATGLDVTSVVESLGRETEARNGEDRFPMRHSDKIIGSRIVGLSCPPYG
ncbi:hypothetical protein RRG08_037959 [Elysia crispata]|uniref:Uncharacterized protein n=1 Tax=Elysia crispata TaxID=231223 RepID=A0AAE1AE43_9GAST|nr:hypothetical protein RRG08_037959 [Elysia crispata]